MAPITVVNADELAAFIEANSFECDDDPPLPVEGKKLWFSFKPKWRQYSSQPGTEIIITEGIDKAEMTVEPIEDPTGEVDLEINVKVKVDAKVFSVEPVTRYSIELPPQLERYWPRDGLDEGSATLWYPGGRNFYAGNCVWTDRDNTPYHLIFIFAEHGEWERGHPVDLAALMNIGSPSKWKLRANITYRIKL